jgi:plasmid stabilization system protein ParE
MEKKIVVSKRFRKNTLNIYEYLIREYSAKTAFNFLNKVQQRVELIIQYPEIGKPSQSKENIRSVTLQPHNRIYYRLSKNKIELLCMFDMRKRKLPY